MKIVLLHSADALGPPEDPVLGQVEAALREGGHEVGRVADAVKSEQRRDQLQGALRRRDESGIVEPAAAANDGVEDDAGGTVRGGLDDYRLDDAGS